MKTSIAHLPEEVQHNLEELKKYILNKVPETQYIILYGSYARGDYTEYDQRVEFGMRTYYQSDFDIVILTPKKRAAQASISRRLDDAQSQYIEDNSFLIKPLIHFFELFVEDFNDAIIEGRYVYTDIVKEGIVLYNSGNYEIEPVRELDYPQILKLSKEYYKEKYTKAEVRLDVARYLYSKQKFKDASFDLHQATENYLLAMLLTASLYSGKTHDIKKLVSEVTMFTPDAAKVFERKTVKGERLLEFLKKAYVQSRYNKNFRVSKESLDKLFEKVESLRVVSKKFCQKTIREHKKRAIE